MQCRIVKVTSNLVVHTYIFAVIVCCCCVHAYNYLCDLV